MVEFQSTLSMRRATDTQLLNILREYISIHALHEESDMPPPPPLSLPDYFNPRSP